MGMLILKLVYGKKYTNENNKIWKPLLVSVAFYIWFLCLFMLVLGITNEDFILALIISIAFPVVIVIWALVVRLSDRPQSKITADTTAPTSNETITEPISDTVHKQDDIEETVLPKTEKLTNITQDAYIPATETTVKKECTNKSTAKKKKNVIAIVLAVFLIASVAGNAFLLYSMQIYDESTSAEIADLYSEIEKLEELTAPVLSDPIISEKTSNLNLYELESLGNFETIKDMETQLQRNLENPEHMKVSVRGYIARTEDRLYLCNVWGASSRHSLKNDNVSSVLNNEKNDKILIYMIDDTTNRVLSGDEVIITGILDTSNMYITDCTYEMIS